MSSHRYWNDRLAKVQPSRPPEPVEGDAVVPVEGLARSAGRLVAQGVRNGRVPVDLDHAGQGELDKEGLRGPEASQEGDDVVRSRRALAMGRLADDDSPSSAQVARKLS